jgi:hypothetical protein
MFLEFFSPVRRDASPDRQPNIPRGFEIAPTIGSVACQLNANGGTMQRFARFFLLLAAFVILPTLPAAASKPATIRIQLYKAGFVVGVSGGSGLLHFNGHHYPLSIAGVSLGATIGASRADLIGNVYNLRDAADIQGTYTAAEAGAALAGGSKVARLKNSQGVILEVHGKQIGLILSVDLSGMQISFKR